MKIEYLGFVLPFIFLWIFSINIIDDRFTDTEKGGLGLLTTIILILSFIWGISVL
ncbi:hypothetical protein M0R04_14390 [Candidatus Dojkabacteria bacterium]|jgi:hypothetical protein|nr:hypothetical protein [Candidatus Dojkabacteria bacterium]